MLFPRRVARAALAVVAGAVIALAAAPGWAGQVNLGDQSSLSTIISTSLSTISNSIFSTTTFPGGGSEIVIQSIHETVHNTTHSTVHETIAFNGQPADVSIEISEEGLTLNSPFGNDTTATTLSNEITVTDSAGLTQVQGSAGSGNVAVAANSILDGDTLSGLLDNTFEPGTSYDIALLLLPGLQLNSKKVVESLIANSALSASADAGVIVAVDMQNKNVAEFSPSGNTTTVTDEASNDLIVTSTSGITQVQGQVGSGNLHSAHNFILYNSNLNRLSSDFGFEASP